MKRLFYRKLLMKLLRSRFLGKNSCGSILILTYLHYGSGAYVCGETTLIESLEGKKGQLDLNHPFLRMLVYLVPTTVNNVETIAVIPTI